MSYVRDRQQDRGRIIPLAECSNISTWHEGHRCDNRHGKTLLVFESQNDSGLRYKRNGMLGMGKIDWWVKNARSRFDVGVVSSMA